MPVSLSCKIEPFGGTFFLVSFSGMRESSPRSKDKNFFRCPHLCLVPLIPTPLHCQGVSPGSSAALLLTLHSRCSATLLRCLAGFDLSPQNDRSSRGMDLLLLSPCLALGFEAGWNPCTLRRWLRLMGGRRPARAELCWLAGAQ